MNISSKHVTSIFISVTMSTEIVSVSDDANCDDAPQENQGCLLLIGRHAYPKERILYKRPLSELLSYSKKVGKKEDADSDDNEDNFLSKKERRGSEKRILYYCFTILFFLTHINSSLLLFLTTKNLLRVFTVYYGSGSPVYYGSPVFKNFTESQP